MRSDVNFQIARAGLSHPAQVLTNQIACFTVVIVTAIACVCACASRTLDHVTVLEGGKIFYLEQEDIFIFTKT